MKMVKRALAAGAALMLGSGPAMAAWSDLNLRVGVTELSREIYGLHMLILWICVAIAAAVFGVMIYSIATFRKSKGAVAATFDHNTKAEIVWTVIPVLILVGMAVPAARTLVKIEDIRGSELTVKVTGYQWKWQYEYVDHGVSFFSTLARSSDEARRLADEVRAKAVAGADFNALAREVSEDRSAKANGGQLGWFTFGEMDPAFAKAAFALSSAGELSQPVQSSFGWHVIRLEGRRPAVQKSYEEVRDAILAELRQKYVDEQREAAVAKLRADPTIRANREAIDALVTRVDLDAVRRAVRQQAPGATAPPSK